MLFTTQMLIFLLNVLITAALMWVMLLVVVFLLRRLLDYSLPRWPEVMWRLAIVAGGTGVASVAGTWAHAYLGMLIWLIAGWILLVKVLGLGVGAGLVVVLAAAFLPMLVLLLMALI